MKYIDDFLNGITMYKLVMYGLMILAFISIGFGFLGIISYGGFSLLLSFFVLMFVGHYSSILFSKFFKVPLNVESAYITSLILFFILYPLTSFSDLPLFIGLPILALVSKYVLVIRKKSLFNPAATAVLLASIFGSGISAWWVGSFAMLLPVLILGFLVLRKVRRFSLFISFTIFACPSAIIFGHLNGATLLDTLSSIFLSGPLIFLGTIMLTEPSTTPPKKVMQIIYGAIVGGLFGAQFHFGPVYSTPALALIIGNLFAYFVSPKEKLVLALKEKIKSAEGVYSFVFNSPDILAFEPGQYLEWTLSPEGADIRGNRRYFTIASSPTEENLMIGVKFYDKPSSFKQKLLGLNTGDTIMASQRAGEFTLPKDKNEKLVFIAGGIGVTPFRSMAKYLIDKAEKRDIVFFYSNKAESEVAFKEIFTEAEKVGLRTIYNIGILDSNSITTEVPDYKNRTFYISGPRGMILAFESTLQNLGIPKSKIKTDFFPGFV